MQPVLSRYFRLQLLKAPTLPCDINSPKPLRRRSLLKGPSKLVAPFAALTTTSGKDTPAGLAIPERTGTSSVIWQPQLAKRSRNELKTDLETLTRDINKQIKRLKPSTSYDSDYWSANAEMSRLCQHRAAWNLDSDFSTTSILVPTTHLRKAGVMEKRLGS